MGVFDGSASLSSFLVDGSCQGPRPWLPPRWLRAQLGPRLALLPPHVPSLLSPHSVVIPHGSCRRLHSPGSSTSLRPLGRPSAHGCCHPHSCPHLFL